MRSLVRTAGRGKRTIRSEAAWEILAETILRLRAVLESMEKK